MDQPRGASLQAWLFVGVGTLVLLAAQGVIEAKLRVSRPLVACVGLAFAGCGAAQLLHAHRRLSVAALSLAGFCMGGILAHVALRPEQAGVSAIGQAGAGLGAFLCYAATFYLLVRLVMEDGNA